MSMVTMRGYRPKDDPLYPGQPIVTSRLGSRQSSTDTAKSLDGATPDKSPPATNRRAGPDRRTGLNRRERPVIPVEGEISQAGVGLGGKSDAATA
jgi:hypothetical protein